MLIENTLFGVVDKVNDALFLLKENEPADGYFVCFSGGKDSVVVLDLVKRAGVKFEAHYSYMTIEPPELLEFIVNEYPEVIFDYPSTTMYDLIIYNHIPPMRSARYCCRMLKVPHGIDKIKVTGIRRAESRFRKNRKEVEDRQINPIAGWSTAEVWEYIRKFQVPYCKLYDEGFKRIGCIFCPNSSQAQLAEDARRYPQFVKYFIAALDKIIEIDKKGGRRSRAKDGQPLPYKTGEEWFWAWLKKLPKRTNEIKLF